MNRKISLWSIFISSVLVYGIVAFILLWIMFENVYACVIITLIASPIFFYMLWKYIKIKKQQQIESEFYLLLSRISMSMASGAILENALKETISMDIKNYKVLGNDLEKMYRMLQNNYPVESTFKVLSQSTNNIEIKIFYDVLNVGRPLGINMSELIRYLSSAYRMRADTESEITRILNAPKYNNRAVMIMPFVCVALFRQMAPDYMECLYTMPGRIIMIIVFVMLILAWLIGERLGKISY